MLRVLTSLVLALVIPSAVVAQGATGRAGAKGFSLGVGLNGSGIKSEDLSDDETDSGGGIQFGLGWGFTPKLMLFLDGAGASISSEDGSWILAHADLGLRYVFASPSRAFAPYVEGALTGWSGSQDDVRFLGAQPNDLEISGGGASLGGGFYYYFSRLTALNVGLRWTSGEFTTVKFGNITVDGLDADATSTRFNVGLTWFFGNRR